jgi:antitoxin component YwqK of YwqJK toxin-antitoxin module
MKNILFLIVINLCVIGQSNAQEEPFEILKLKKSSCYSYFKREDHIDLNFTGIDTVECYSMGEKLKILRFFEKGKKVLIEAYYDNGNLYKTQSFLNNQFNGATMEFYKNGNNRSFFYYDNGYRKISILWHENSLLRSITEGEQHNGEFFKTTEFDTLGRIINTAYRSDSITNALHDIIYYPCSSKKVETTYNNGVQPYIAYYENGNKYLEGEIFQGDFARIGKWQEWYENGVLKREYFFDENQPNVKTGMWSWWDENGNLIKQEVYKNNEIIEEKTFLPNTNNKD